MFSPQSEATQQWIWCGPSPPFNSRKAQKQLFHKYQLMHTKMHDNKNNKKYTVRLSLRSLLLC